MTAVHSKEGPGTQVGGTPLFVSSCRGLARSEVTRMTRTKSEVTRNEARRAKRSDAKQGQDEAKQEFFSKWLEMAFLASFGLENAEIKYFSLNGWNRIFDH